MELRSPAEAEAVRSSPYQTCTSRIEETEADPVNT